MLKNIMEKIHIFFNRIITFYSKFSFTDVFIFFMILISTFIFLYIIYDLIKSRRNKSKFRVIRRKENKLKKLLEIIEIKHKRLYKIINFISYKICIYNKSSLDKNREYSLIILISITAILFILVFFVLPSINLIWYVFLGYMIIAIFFISAFLYFLYLNAIANFDKALPKTFKLINSRLIITHNIIDSIKASLKDLDKGIHRELFRMADALDKNTKATADKVFKEQRAIYKNNQYFILLTYLIEQAYYKGITKELKKEFENITEEILMEIEHKRDIQSISRMIIFFSFFVPVLLVGFEKFNIEVLGDYAANFYSSPEGLTLKIGVLLSTMIFIMAILLLEKI